MLFIGDDWAEADHDIEILDADGRRLARRRLPEGVDGLAALHGLVANYLAEDDEADRVVIGIETDRGPWVGALIAAGYTVYAVNPLQVARYRERHATSGARATRVMCMCWRSWCGWIGPITGRWPGTRRSPSTSRCSPAPTSR